MNLDWVIIKIVSKIENKIPKDLFLRAKSVPFSYTALTVITVMGFCWRYLLIRKNYSFLYDEAWDFIQSNTFTLGQFLRGQYWDVALHPPLHYIFFRFWSQLGREEFFLRLPFVAAGTLSVLVFFLVSRELVRSTRYSLLATLLYASLGFSVYYSIQVRITQPLILLELATLYFFLRANRYPEKLKNWLFSGLFMGLAFYLDYSVFWLAVILDSFFLFKELFFEKWKDKSKIQNWLLMNILLVLLIFPWLPIFIKNAHDVGNLTAYLGKATPDSLMKLLISQTFGFEWSFYQFQREHQSLKIFPYLLVLLAIIPSTIWLVRSFWIAKVKAVDKKMILLLGCFFLPIMVSFLVSQFLPIFQDRNLAIFSLYPILALALGMKSASHWLGKTFFFLVSMIFLGINAYTLNFLFHNPIGADWRGAALYLIQNLRPGDVLVAHPDGFNKPITYYLKYRYNYNFASKKVDFISFAGEEKENLLNSLSERDYWLFVDKVWEENIVGSFSQEFSREARQRGKAGVFLKSAQEIGGISIYQIGYKENP